MNGSRDNANGLPPITPGNLAKSGPFQLASEFMGIENARSTIPVASIGLASSALSDIEPAELTNAMKDVPPAEVTLRGISSRQPASNKGPSYIPNQGPSSYNGR